MPDHSPSTSAAPAAPPAPLDDVGRLIRGTKVLAAVGVVLCAAGLVVGFALVGRHGGGPVQGLDNAVGRWFLAHRAPYLGVSKVIATYFDALPLGIGCFIVSVVLAVRFRATWAAIPFVSFLGGEALVTAIRLVIHRARPLTAIYPAPGSIRGMHETSFSFPSGHSVAVTAVLFSMLGFHALARRTWWPWVIAALAASCVGFSRLVLGVHWLSDALFGVLLGAMWGVAVAFVARNIDWGDLRALARRVAAPIAR